MTAKEERRSRIWDSRGRRRRRRDVTKQGRLLTPDDVAGAKRPRDFLVSRPIFTARALIFWYRPAVTHRAVVAGPVNHPVLCGARRGATADCNRLARKVAPRRADLCTRAAY